MSRTTSFIPRLESMRGIAALLVAASHVVQSPTGPDTGLLTHPGANAGEVIRLFSAAIVHAVDGLQAVIFFFVLSGFVLLRSLLAEPRPSASQATDFVIARLFRLYPAVIFAVAVYALARTVFGAPPAPWTVLENMALIDTSLNGVMWSLQLELLAIPLIYGMYLLLLRRTTATTAAAIAICLALVGMSFDPAIHKILGHPPLQLYYAFTFGCFCAAASGRWAARLTPTQANIATAIAIVLFFTARPLLGPASAWRFVVNGLSAWMLIYLVTYGPRATLLNVLDHPAAHWLGRLSFSYYLFHFLTILPVWSHPETVVWLVDTVGMPRLLIAGLIFLASTAAALLLAYIAYTLVEIPGIRLGRQVRAIFTPRIRNAQTG
ncbi:acyltransferase [Rhodopseudomonas sp. HC1]|uniref:acyltransferase family protein n=1 Tax=Rhodopseudomonas infernalis TaxID=2897386 RepID=UPI001EE8D503|nr:acyltransferase [Rhodopseudomonas infernalis]MCG6206382.1 acyltransferase [Rhodopseudomonas infernalis]